MLALKNSGNFQSCVILKPEYNIFDVALGLLFCVVVVVDVVVFVCHFVLAALLL